MSTKSFAPKIRVLSENETPTTFEAWKETLLFHLSTEIKFDTFLDTDFTWSAYSVDNRGLIADAAEVPAASRMTARQRAAALQLMLGSIATYAPVIGRKFITQEATSLNRVWNRLRTHYGFRKTGARILELSAFQLESAESYETLWERMYAFVDDNVVGPNDGLTHCGGTPEQEFMSPTILNIIVVLWLHAIHHDLPPLVKQRFATELRGRTLFSIREEVTESLQSLITELQEGSGAISRSSYQTRGGSQEKYQPPTKSCCLCKAANRREYNSHYLSACPFLPENDKKFISSRIRDVAGDILDPCNDTDLEGTAATTSRVDIVPSLIMKASYNQFTTVLTLDSGAESNLISLAEAKRIGAPISTTRNRARQADGSTPLNAIGETHFVLTKDHHTFSFNGLVVQQLGVAILAGMPFQRTNDVFTRPAKGTVHVGDCCMFECGAQAHSKGTPSANTSRCTAVILRVPNRTTILPGECIEMNVPAQLACEESLAVEPRTSAPSMSSSKQSQLWLSYDIVNVTDGTIKIRNSSAEPIPLKKHEQICQIRPMIPQSETPEDVYDESQSVPNFISVATSSADKVNIDPSGMLSVDERKLFQDTTKKHSSVFDSQLGCYNGFNGTYENVINMGPTLPPQRKGRIPQYNRKDLVSLQQKFDELELAGVFIKPELIGINVEYINPSFLVKKPSGGFRLVTSFGEVGKYSKPQPALMSNVDNTLRRLGQWRYIIQADLSQAFYQIPIARQSMKYCGVCTPFKGVRVYQRCAMGMPGSEVALEELLSRLLGELITEGYVAKVADDLYCGAQTVSELHTVWNRLLTILSNNGLHLSPTKTVCCPATAQILGWNWNKGSISAGSHRISALATCDPPSSVRGLRAYIGAYKFLSRVLPAYATILAPIEDAVAGRQSSETISWTDSLVKSFVDSQNHLTNTKSIMLPRSTDQLQIVTDGSVTKMGIAATMFVVRESGVRLAGYFNAKLKDHQIRWLPCELEALGISAAVKHFSPYIVQSKHQTRILTDSKPCVQAYDKLCRGYFSASVRLTTFLSTVSRFHVSVDHIKGEHNTLVDYESRNPQCCQVESCQICKFVLSEEDSVIGGVSVESVLSGHFPLMYSNRAAWKAVQQDCPDLRRVHAHLAQGTRPSRKETKLSDIRRYLNTVIIAKDGVLTVAMTSPMMPKTERIVVPRQIVAGLLTAMHLQLQHPSKYQLGKVFSRTFFALDFDKSISSVVEHCHACKSLGSVPTRYVPQSTSMPESIGCSFSADIMRRNRQFILIARENISAYTLATLVPDERACSLRDGLLRLCSLFGYQPGRPITVRVDAAPGFRSLVGDVFLKSEHINLEIGNEKNINKNPIAERAVSEVHQFLVRSQPGVDLVTETSLTSTIGKLNNKLRLGGLSSRELWTQRCQYSGEQLPIKDRDLIVSRHNERLNNHESSAKWKARGCRQMVTPQINVGDITYLHADRSKLQPRDKYLVVESSGDEISIQKFVGNQLRARRYIVRPVDCVVVPREIEGSKFVPDSDSSDDDSIYGQPVTDPSISPDSTAEHSDHSSTPDDNHLRRSTRMKFKPAYLADYVEH